MVTVTKLNVSNPDPNSGGGNVIDHRKTMHEILFYLMNRFSLPPLKEFRKPGILLDVWVCREMCLDLCHKLGNSSSHLEAECTSDYTKVY